MPRWEQVLEPLVAQLRADGTVGPQRFRAVASRLVSIPPVVLPRLPMRVSATGPVTPSVAKPFSRNAMPVLGRLRLHLDYVRTADAGATLESVVPMCDRAWFRHEVDRLDRARRRARRVGEARLDIPGTAPAAIESLVEYFGLRAVASALASVAATDDPLRHPASIGPLVPQRVRSAVSATHVTDNRGLTARERAARRGFYVA
jgi:hypothetical protein